MVCKIKSGDSVGTACICSELEEINLKATIYTAECLAISDAMIR